MQLITQKLQVRKPYRKQKPHTELGTCRLPVLQQRVDKLPKAIGHPGDTDLQTIPGKKHLENRAQKLNSLVFPSTVKPTLLKTNCTVG
ncbi:hypothetical protein AV530_016850 [Patagioenas fasciata monilis]|uniref:Uncharacterized protein n=1 Tax=Patagioenas fasciata monilis TaxID=372326 RepID=A0A1V4J3S7_PATFA|nr:hypothetical protein AV530_016850 [Patagioenas fasciata monilis]